jgi:O-antigen ligase
LDLNQVKKMSLESGSDATDRVWSGVLAAWLASVLLLGGAEFPVSLFQSYITLTSLGLVFASLWRLRNEKIANSLIFVGFIAVLSLGLVLFQLLPIPYEIWRVLPGREVMVQAFDSIGAPPESLALSLSPLQTKITALSVLPPLAAFLAVLSVPRRYLWTLSLAILACALVGCIIGLIQKSQGAASGLYFHRDPGTAKIATGTFANRNFFATQLFTSIPFLAAFAMSWAKHWNVRPLLTFAFATIYIGLLIAVLAAIGSRAGVILAMASVLLTFTLVFRASTQSGRISAGKGLVLLVVTLVVMAQASMVGILRLAETDPIGDFRNTITSVSFSIAKSQFPAGSGFGTFVPVYQIYETPATIIDPYINHAHNEWLEVALEGGAPAMALIFLFVTWLAHALYKALRLSSNDPAHAHIRAAGVACVLLLLHAIVDFPFRNDAMLALFGLCVGLLCLSSMAIGQGTRWPKANNSSQKMRSTKTGEFKPKNGGFVKRRINETQDPIGPSATQNINLA